MALALRATLYSRVPLRRATAIVAMMLISPIAATAEPPAPDKHVFFGDLHVHTTYSLDALVFGTFKGPDDAYRFAQGDPLTMIGGSQYRLDRPLDFTAVTDHAFGLGEYAICTDGPQPDYDRPLCQALRSGTEPTALRPLLRGRASIPPRRNPDLCGVDGKRCLEASIGPWQEIQRIADHHYRPGTFTTFIGYEWTPADAAGRTVHRNVIFRGNDVPKHAMSVFDLPLVEDLWAWLSQACSGSCEALTIPHNANFSGGLMFAPTNQLGKPLTTTDWRRRMDYERIVEVMQVKGSSECALGIGTTDEECAFEQTVPLCSNEDEGRCARSHTFARDGLKEGLRLKYLLGFNPMAFGLIGSTDTHTAAAGATAEDRYAGHHSGLDDTPEDALAGKVPTGEVISRFTPGALAAVWAKDNTRESIFDAMRRRETYATSGTRILLRFGSSDGATMGGVIHSDLPPTFTVEAWRDPLSAPLSKLQLVKGWLEADGTVYDKVWDISCAKGSPIAETRRCPKQPSSLDLSTCDIGSSANGSHLTTDWTDPEFDPLFPAFYYVRAIEAPTCRWTTVIAQTNELAVPDHVPLTVEERAWSSPIWFEPSTRKP